MGKHSTTDVPQKPQEPAEYCSRDVQFDWPEGYEPPFPLTDAERRLQDLNRTEMMATVELLKEKTRDVLYRELIRAAEEYPGRHG